MNTLIFTTVGKCKLIAKYIGKIMVNRSIFDENRGLLFVGHRVDSRLL